MKTVWSIFIIIVISTRTNWAQYPCLCTCCAGENCQPTLVSYAYGSSCTQSSCLQACSDRYFQCTAQSPYGQASGSCLSATTPVPILAPYSCRCDCCNFISSSCTPSLVGYTTSYSCSISSCSIACNNKYPLLCVSSENGQTQGTCQGFTMTTTSTTTIGPFLGYACSCYCCQSGPYCSPAVNVGSTSALYCSTYACTLACQAQYPSLCPSTSTIGQTSGRCTNITTGSNKCACNCCGTSGCLDYDLYTNDDCTTCSLLCQQQTQCVNTFRTTYTCDSNSSVRIRFSLLYLEILIIIIEFKFILTT